ncbi:hypothetical protein QJS04_geneDACA016973 [Acorus gramineus]|uniref:Uncharacterized protein n=1 Tax=Acorus gramineus TaxID=55184 RepID=A0AAV9AM80_ACOGR|nr:hypothetical protein QJS04_geneDACA016973 [Acorus gramineus]
MRHGQWPVLHPQSRPWQAEAHWERRMGRGDGEEGQEDRGELQCLVKTKIIYCGHRALMVQSRVFAVLVVWYLDLEGFRSSQYWIHQECQS